MLVHPLVQSKRLIALQWESGLPHSEPQGEQWQLGRPQYFVLISFKNKCRWENNETTDKAAPALFPLFLHSAHSYQTKRCSLKIRKVLFFTFFPISKCIHLPLVMSWIANDGSHFCLTFYHLSQQVEEGIGFDLVQSDCSVLRTQPAKLALWAWGQCGHTELGFHTLLHHLKIPNNFFDNKPHVLILSLAT